MTSQDDHYAVYLRSTNVPPENVEKCERAVATLPSYEEARRVCQSFHDRGRACVIRFLGDAGGGD